MPRRHVIYNERSTAFARQLRKQMTKAEVMLWERLKGGQVLGFRFHRQKPIGNFIVDFYCPALRLAIEVDGSTHFDREQYDNERDEVLKRFGVIVLRFGDRQVKENTYGTVEMIKDQIKSMALRSSPSV